MNRILIGIFLRSLDAIKPYTTEQLSTANTAWPRSALANAKRNQKETGNLSSIILPTKRIPDMDALERNFSIFRDLPAFKLQFVNDWCMTYLVVYMILTIFVLPRRSTEISLLLKQTFEAAIMSHLFPRSQIDIFVQVLQADGGKRSLFITTWSRVHPEYAS